MGEILATYGNVVATLIMIAFIVTSGLLKDIYNRLRNLEHETVKKEDMTRMRKEDYDKIDKRLDKLEDRLGDMCTRIDSAIHKICIERSMYDTRRN